MTTTEVEETKRTTSEVEETKRTTTEVKTWADVVEEEEQESSPKNPWKIRTDATEAGKTLQLPDESFPSLQAAKTVTKKEKHKILAVGQFHVPLEVSPSKEPEKLTVTDMVSLPKAPTSRPKVDDERSRGDFGRGRGNRGFDSYSDHGNRGFGAYTGRGFDSYTDHSRPEGDGRYGHRGGYGFREQEGVNGFESRPGNNFERSGFGGHGKADAEDNWVANKNFATPAQPRPRYEESFVPTGRADAVDNWVAAKKFTPTPSQDRGRYNHRSWEPKSDMRPQVEVVKTSTEERKSDKEVTKGQSKESSEDKPKTTEEVTPKTTEEVTPKTTEEVTPRPNAWLKPLKL